MASRSSSPLLPTFGIRDLSGPAPGLISITRSQYESTIKSQPDAKLLYLDDDDGELITVGSSLELKQRLEEPVAQYAKGTYIDTHNPADGKLVHVFDIQRSGSSVAEWRDHEAYSSKIFRRPSSPPSPAFKLSPMVYDATHAIAEDTRQWTRSEERLIKSQRVEACLKQIAESRSPAEVDANTCSLTSAWQSGLSSRGSPDPSLGAGFSRNTTSDINIGTRSKAAPELGPRQRPFESEDIDCGDSNSNMSYTPPHTEVLHHTRSFSYPACLCPFCPSRFHTEFWCRQHQLAQHYSLLAESQRRAFSAEGQHGYTVVDDIAPNAVPHKEPFDVLSGVEEHLNGLADVLQTAATTLKRAADKTRERDTSIVEDILQGVKNILFEVGSFGVEVFKEINRPPIPEVSPLMEARTSPVTVNSSLSQESVQHDASDEADRSDESSDVGNDQITPSVTSFNSNSSGVNARVKFAFAEDDADDSSEPQAPSSAIRSTVVEDNIHQDDEDDKMSKYSDASPDLPDSKPSNPFDDAHFRRLVNPSILDDSSEDAEFTARYPPLHSVRRARSTIESDVHKRHSTAPPLPKRRILDIYPQQLCTKGIEFPPAARQSQEASEKPHKPLPGAWPESRVEPVSVLPVSSESSGTFFNRMVYRDQSQGRAPSGLQRANTTASSNPASRLNGPFDPGFPYEPSRMINSHNGPRSLRRPNVPFRDLSDQLVSRSASLKGSSSRLNTKRSVPNFVCSKGRTPTSVVDARPKSSSREPNGFTKFESHRAVKHHRSVPHFQPYVHAHSLPGQFLTGPGLIRPKWNRQSSTPTPDYLTGSGIPRAPLSSFPAVAPQPYVASPTPRLPPAPQLRPYVPLPTVSSSPINFYSPLAPVNIPIAMTQDEEPHQPSKQSVKCDLTGDSNQPGLDCSSPVSRVSSDADLIEANQEENKFTTCVEHLLMCGFGIDDDNMKDRLHVYAIAANGDVEEAVEMIEEDRRVSQRFD